MLPRQLLPGQSFMSDIRQFYKAETFRIEESVGFLVKNLSHVLSRELDRRMMALDLTDAQWKPLLLLQQGVSATAADLARTGCKDTGAVTRLLDRLETKGLLRRIRSEQDRRVVNLELTEEGTRVSAEVPKIIANMANQVLEGFTREEFLQFRQYLSRALKNAQALDEANAGQGDAP